MMRRLLFVLLPVLILLVPLYRFMSARNIRQDGVPLLLPVSVVDSGKDGFSDFAVLRYQNFIPVAELTGDTGTVIINRMPSGRISFSRPADGIPLRPREMFLKYKIVPPPAFSAAQDSRPGIRFAAPFLRFRSAGKFKADSVRYAVVKTDKNGNTVLAGIADRNGVLLAEGL